LISLISFPDKRSGTIQNEWKTYEITKKIQTLQQWKEIQPLPAKQLPRLLNLTENYIQTGSCFYHSYQMPDQEIAALTFSMCNKYLGIVFTGREKWRVMGGGGGW
jgi:hypothetical protein